MGIEEELRSIDTDIFSDKERVQIKRTLLDNTWTRLTEENRHNSQSWRKVQSRTDWEKFSNKCIKALYQSLGKFPHKPLEIHGQVTSIIKNKEFLIKNIVFESRPGFFVTANLYLPNPSRGKMPGILVSHGHNYSKAKDFLQYIGMALAKLGVIVLVIDQIGHGERRQQPWGGRQDYYSRYSLGLQLYLVGESLMGWMVNDMICGISLLLNQPNIDADKIILFGGPAGGGDVAAVTAALDSRIKCVIPFNFGGPVPETHYPLSDDSETTFNYAGYGEWESTRCLRLSARDGFLPWTIVGSIAPRYLIYAHEFSWDHEHDPVWKRLQKVYSFYDALNNLDSVFGTGFVHEDPPKASHGILPLHRKRIYPILNRWFDIPIPKEELEPYGAFLSEDLACLTPEVKDKLQPKMVHELAAELGETRIAAARRELEKFSISDQRNKLRNDWARLLGDVEPKGDPKSEIYEKKQLSDFLIEKVVLEVEKDITVPIILLLPKNEKVNQKVSIVVAISQRGKQAFLKERTKEIVDLLKNSIAVCLPDFRGTGETHLDNTYERDSKETEVSANELMLGQTLLGSRLRDLRSILRYLRKRPEIEHRCIALWGDSFAQINPKDFTDLPYYDVRVLKETEKMTQPHLSEPLGALLALSGALFEEDICAVVVRGGLVGYMSLLSSHFCYIPYSVVIPGVLTIGDISDIAAALSPLPLRIEGMVDGRNCLVKEKELTAWFKTTMQSYTLYEDKLQIKSQTTNQIANWLIKTINKREESIMHNGIP